MFRMDAGAAKLSIDTLLSVVLVQSLMEQLSYGQEPSRKVNDESDCQEDQIRRRSNVDKQDAYKKEIEGQILYNTGEFCEIRTNGIEGIEEGGPNSFLEEDLLNSCSRVLIEHTFLQITPVQLLPSANALF